MIDCPDLPLNVSRSALQNDGFVQKIAEYISKKVADKLSGMCKTDKETYEKYWDDISPFIKFGCLKDEKFCDKMKDYILFKNLDHNYLTLKECIEKNGGTIVEPNENKEDENEDANTVTEDMKTTIYYVTDEQQQSQYINTSITDCKPMLLKSRRSIQDKIVQILITTIKLLDSICRIQSNNF